MRNDEGPDGFELWLRTNAGQAWAMHWKTYPIHPGWRR
jgi:hypothetical protein